MSIFDNCLLVSDIDGTLIGRSCTLPQRNKDAIAYFIANGGKFAIATGRTPQTAKALYDETGSNTHLICFNGAGVYDYKAQKYHYCMFLTDEAKQTVLPFIEKFNCGTVVATDEGGYIINANAESERHCKLVGVQLKNANYNDIINKNWVKVLFLAKDRETANKIYDYALTCNPKDAYYLRTHKTYIELTCKGADKSVGATELKKLIGAKELFTIGDFDNDISMLKTADISAAAGLAPDYVKNEADYICGNPEVGAVADFIAILERMKKLDNNKLLQLKKTACEIRMGVIESTHSAKSGHPGGSLSCTDILTYLYFVEMNVDPKNPADPSRDRFILSKGHCAPALYSTLAQKGYFDKSELKQLRHTGAMLQGHPDLKKIPGVDMSSGSLGQGISAAVGMALSAKHFGDSYRVYTVLGDGECEEGQVWEAAMFAANKKLDNLVAFVDVNNLQIDGTLEQVNSPLPLDKKFEAFGWNVVVIDGHSFEEIEGACIKAATTKGVPTAVIAKTVKGKGVSFMENQVSWHGSAPNDEKYEIAMNELKAQFAAL